MLTKAEMVPLRLEQVAGFKERTNDVVYCKPLVDSSSTKVVIFFPGDVQDYIENMEANHDVEIYKKWNLESCASDLQNKFSECHILVIRPCKLHCKMISCFGNFVTSSEDGVPTYTPNYDSFRHLNRLLKGVEERLVGQSNEGSSSEEWNSQQKLNLLQLDLIIIGFSKGCVVLNQFLYELHHFKSNEFDEEVDAVTGRIRDMFWLDGGHSGGKNTWVVDENVLKTLSLADINVHVVVTPYQIEDVNRPWIQIEENLFSTRLLEYNCKLERKQHFMNSCPTLLNHFRLLNVFERSA
ncbi:mitochondrial protein C2orf69 homolog isoform X2 [Dendroctonus ponderosae]|uniref:mitochondrial protein C2orf69 homolog isoform X2 n=1 Tax=Dendroctonus ponderosae TaxID=77166 RepID=UPI002035D7B8|nr:mitochondrial protein C2orf69 homolog isoform X2 [Dendroctonus ponderosae]